jgi:hypothetical protein
MYIEETIINAVKALLSGRVNEILGETEDRIPPVEFGKDGLGYSAGGNVCPEVTLTQGEREEKDRIVKVDGYTLGITIRADERPSSWADGERVCYAYAGAVGRALAEDPTLGGTVDRAVFMRKKYTPPKKPGCGDGWEVAMTVRVTVEGGAS